MLWWYCLLIWNVILRGVVGLGCGYIYIYVKVKVLIAQWVSLCDSKDCRLPDSSIHGILQARIVEWVAIPFSKGSSRPRNLTQVSCIAGRFFTVWATREAIYVYTYHYISWLGESYKIKKQNTIKRFFSSSPSILLLTFRFPD